MVNVIELGKAEGDNKLLSPLAKQYILIFLTSLIGAASGFLFERGFLFFGIISLIIFISAFIAHTLFIKERRLIFTSTIANSLLFAAPLMTYVSKIYFVAVLVLIVFFFISINKSVRASKNMINIKFLRVVRVAGGPAITAVVVFLSAIFILANTFTIPEENNFTTPEESNFKIPEESIKQILSILSLPISKYVPNFKPDMTAREMFVEIYSKQLSVDEGFREKEIDDQNKIINNYVVLSLEETEKRYGIDIDLEQSVTKNIHSILQSKLEGLTSEAKIYLLVIAIGAFWLSIKSIEFILYIPILLLSALLYQLMLATKFARVENISITKEIIVIG